MKSKPDITGFTSRKDPSAFLEGGAADKADTLVVPAPQATPVPPAPAPAEAPRRGRGRVPKLFNFPEELADRLRDEAAARSRNTGARVTEKDIVIAALEAYLKA